MTSAALPGPQGRGNHLDFCPIPVCTIFLQNPAKPASLRVARETRLYSDAAEQIRYVLSEEQPCSTDSSQGG